MFFIQILRNRKIIFLLKLTENFFFPSCSVICFFSPSSSLQILEQIIFSLRIKVAIRGWCDPFLSLGNPVDRISAFSPGRIYFPSHDGQVASIPSNCISHPHVQLTLPQMAPFCLSGWGDLSLPGHKSGWLQPQRTSSLEQIRLWTIITLLGPLTPTSLGSTAVIQECGHFSTPFTPSASAACHIQRNLLELLFTRKHKLVFYSLSFSFLSMGSSYWCLWKLRDTKSISYPDLYERWYEAW